MKPILWEQPPSPARAWHSLAELISGFGGIAGRMRWRALLARTARGCCPHKISFFRRAAGDAVGRNLNGFQVQGWARCLRESRSRILRPLAVCAA